MRIALDDNAYVLVLTGADIFDEVAIGKAGAVVPALFA